MLCIQATGGSEETEVVESVLYARTKAIARSCSILRLIKGSDRVVKGGKIDIVLHLRFLGSCCGCIWKIWGSGLPLE